MRYASLQKYCYHVYCSDYRYKQLHGVEPHLVRVRPERAQFQRRHGLFVVAIHDASGMRGNPSWRVQHGAVRRRQSTSHAQQLHRLLSSR